MTAMESLKEKFTSGNSVPVSRSTITREEYEALESEFRELKADKERMDFLKQTDGPISPLIENVFIYAARYAHSRQTGAANQVVSAIRASWPQLSRQTKEKLLKEAENEAIFNEEDWQRLAELA